MTQPQEEQLLYLRLPTGSLNNPERGNTEELFRKAQYEIVGYTPGKEKPRPGIICKPPIFYVRIDKPKNMPRALGNNSSDVAIFGNDDYEEIGIPLVEVCNLDYGNVTIVAAVMADLKIKGERIETLDQLIKLKFSANEPVKVSTEFPQSAARYIAGNTTLRTILGYGLGPNDDARMRAAIEIVPLNAAGPVTRKPIQIYVSDGKTELQLYDDNERLIVDTSQTGEGLRQNGARVIETIGKSSARLYTTRTALKDGWKAEQINDLANNLMGVVNARGKLMVKMNVATAQLEGLINYLVQKGYCGKQPTITMFGEYSAVETLIPKLDFLAASAAIRRLGADDIGISELSTMIKNTDYLEGKI